MQHKIYTEVWKLFIEEIVLVMCVEDTSQSTLDCRFCACFIIHIFKIKILDMSTIFEGTTHRSA